MEFGQSARPVRTGPVQFVSGPWLDATKSRRSGEYGSSGDPGGSGETVTSPDGERKRPAEGRSQAQGRSLATRKPTLMSENPTGVLTRFVGRLARGRLSQEPPRIMCCLHAASGSMAEPSDGAPS